MNPFKSSLDEREDGAKTANSFYQRGMSHYSRALHEHELGDLEKALYNVNLALSQYNKSLEVYRRNQELQGSDLYYQLLNDMAEATDKKRYLENQILSCNFPELDIDIYDTVHPTPTNIVAYCPAIVLSEKQIRQQLSQQRNQ